MSESHRNRFSSAAAQNSYAKVLRSYAKEKNLTGLPKQSWENLHGAAEKVEAFRRAVNEGYSEAPDSLDTEFRTAIDQIADQQYQLNQAWVSFAKGDVASAEKEATRAAEEAQRVALNQWRNLAEHHQKEAKQFEEIELRTVQTDITDLLEFKRQCDTEFKTAVQLHEKNESAALAALQKSSELYVQFVQKAKTKIVGTATLSKRERRRQLASYIGVIALTITLIGRDNLINFVKSIWHSIFP